MVNRTRRGRGVQSAPTSDLIVSRRRFVGGGLAALAAALASGGPAACSRHQDGLPLDPAMGDDDEELEDLEASYAPDDRVGDYMTPEAAPLRSRIGELGPLEDADANGLRLPAGCRSRIVAVSGERPVASDRYRWHREPDGGATFATEDGGWIYVSNAEIPRVGGVGALRFDARGQLVASYPILEGTDMNCAGGPTPWRTWLSCEEVARGRVFECDPWGEVEAIERPALGVFKHEAAAVDPVNAHIYLTEDEPDGLLYRFIPEVVTAGGHPDLRAGRLEAASVDAEGRVHWLPVPDPGYEGETPTRLQVPGSTAFRGGEGIWYHAGTIYFSTKWDDRIWAFDIQRRQLDILYDRATSPRPILRGVDNVTVSCCGDVLVAEDGGSMQIVAILPTGEPRAIVQLVGVEDSEITGPAFDPSGTRLYFSSQRHPGITYEVTGPFHV